MRATRRYPEPSDGVHRTDTQFLQRIRAEREATGYPFMTSEEAEAYIEDLRSGDERLEEVYRQIEEEERRKAEENGC